MSKGNKKKSAKAQKIQTEKQRIIGMRLSDLSHEKKITVSELSEQLDVSDQQVSKYRSGNSAPSIAALFQIAEIMECDIDYLLGIIPEKTRSIHELHELSNLTPDACEHLKASTDRDPYLAEDVSWFINNGLFDLILHISNMANEYISPKYELNHMPKALQNILNQAIHTKTNGTEDSLSLKECYSMAIKIQDLNTNIVESLNNMLDDLGIGDDARCIYKYDSILLLDDDFIFNGTPSKVELNEVLFTADQIIEYANNLSYLSLPYLNAFPEKRNELMERQQKDISALMGKYDFIKQNNNSDTTEATNSKRELYNKCINFIDKYKNTEKEKQIRLFNISAELVEMINKYIDHYKEDDLLSYKNEIFHEANAALLKGDEK